MDNNIHTNQANVHVTKENSLQTELESTSTSPNKRDKNFNFHSGRCLLYKIDFNVMYILK